jgi:pimeloyl-ACP methyl ester carboxylesterase
MDVELVRILTRDRLRLDGALTAERQESEVRRQETGSGRITAAILLHGVGGNFYSSYTFAPLIPQLQAAGLAVLSVNTRGHDSVFTAALGNLRKRFGAAYEIVDECRHDVVGWTEFLASRGHEKIALIGHSLGAIKAVYAQVHEKLAQVAMVIAVSPPRLSFSAFKNAQESSLFLESFRTAESMATEGLGEELFTSKFPFPLLITAASYIDKYGPAERYNLLHIAADLPCPARFIFGSKELNEGGIAFAGLPEALMSLPNAARRSVTVIEEADHFYMGVTENLAEEVTRALGVLGAT